MPLSFSHSFSNPNLFFNSGVQDFASSTENEPFQLNLRQGFKINKSQRPSISISSNTAYAWFYTRPISSSLSILPVDIEIMTSQCFSPVIIRFQSLSTSCILSHFIFSGIHPVKINRSLEVFDPQKLYPLQTFK